MKKQMIDLNAEKQKSKTFISLFEDKIKALKSKIKTTNDQLKKVEYQIDIFFTEEEKTASQEQIRVYSDDAAKIIDRRIKRYQIILTLLVEQYEIIRQRLADDYYTDDLEKSEIKIKLFRLQIEIKSKQDFLHKYEERKHVYNNNK